MAIPFEPVYNAATAIEDAEVQTFMAQLLKDTGRGRALISCAQRSEISKDDLQSVLLVRTMGTGDVPAKNIAECYSVPLLQKGLYRSMQTYLKEDPPGQSPHRMLLFAEPKNYLRSFNRPIHVWQYGNDMMTNEPHYESSAIRESREQYYRLKEFLSAYDASRKAA